MSIAGRLSLIEQFEVTRAAANFTHLALLDQVWTNYLERTEPPISDNDISELEDIVKNMTQLLEESENRAEHLVRIVRHHSEELAEEFEQQIQEAELGTNTKSILLNTVKRHGGIVEFSERSLSIIMENSYSEIETLESKISTIKNGEFTLGDLSKTFICGLAGSILVKSLFTPPPANLVPLGIAAGLLIGMEIKGDGC